MKFDPNEEKVFQKWLQTARDMHGNLLRDGRYYHRKECMEAYLKDKAHKKAQAAKQREIEAIELEKQIEPMLNCLDIKLIDLAKIALSTIEESDYSELIQIGSTLKNPLHREQALSEYCSSLKQAFENAIKAYVSDQVSSKGNVPDDSLSDAGSLFNPIGSAANASPVDYEEPKVARKLNELTVTCIELGKSALAEKVGIDFSPGSSSRFPIAKTRKWSES